MLIAQAFKSLLLGETLKEPFISYSHKLPNNKAGLQECLIKIKKNN